MKFFITNFGKGNIIDGNLSYMLGYIPKYSIHQLVDNIEEADVILMTHTFQTEYIFEPQNIGTKPIVILDYLETECMLNNPHFLCFYPSDHVMSHPEYVKLQEWIKSKQTQIKIYFKREFFIDGPEISIPTYPIEFTGNEPFYWNDTTSSPEQFWARTCFVSFVWGLSNASRPILHGEMMKKYGGAQLCLDETMFAENKNNERIALFYKPYYMRSPFNEMMTICGQSKICISMWGAGRKCFRDVEASFNSVMAIQESSYYYAYPWIHGENCIFLPNKILENGYIQIDEEKSLAVINDYLHRHEELYKIYIAGKNNCINYRIDNYLTKYLIPKLEKINEL